MLDSGFKLSDLSNIPVTKNECTKQSKIAFDNTFFLSYSHSVYGINYKRQNYKIPLNTIRDDIRGYIGIESLKEPWRGQLKIWHGNWSNDIDENSYVYDNTEILSSSGICAANKFSDLENSFYLIKDAPFPFETENQNNRETGGELAGTYKAEGAGLPVIDSINVPLMQADPYPDSHKLVTKKYIDERLASKRIVEVLPKFTVRDYDCIYIIRAENLENYNEIEVTYPQEFNKRALHNKLQFSILIEGKPATSDKWNAPVRADMPIIFKTIDDENINLIWLNNNKPDISDSGLYNKSRYLFLRFESVTNNIELKQNSSIVEGLVDLENIKNTKQTIVDGLATTAKFDVYGVCENALYLLNGAINRIDSTDSTINIDSKGSVVDLGINVELTSTDNDSLIIEKRSAGKWDFSVIQKPDIELISTTQNTLSIEKDANKWKLGVTCEPGLKVKENDKFLKVDDDNNLFFEQSFTTLEKTLADESNLNIKLSASDKISYYSKAEQLNLTFENDINRDDICLKIDIYYQVNSEHNNIINDNIHWVGTENGTQPSFINGRLYYITLTYAPNLYNGKIIARINWFI